MALGHLRTWGLLLCFICGSCVLCMQACMAYEISQCLIAKLWLGIGKASIKNHKSLK